MMCGHTFCGRAPSQTRSHSSTHVASSERTRSKPATPSETPPPSPQGDDVFLPLADSLRASKKAKKLWPKEWVIKKISGRR